MKTGKAIKLSLLLFSVSSAMYQLPRMLEMVEGVKSGGALGLLGGSEGGLGGIEGLSGLGGSSNVFSLMSQLQGGGSTETQSPPSDGSDLQVFSPDGGHLTDRQRAELLAAASRLRPRIERDVNGRKRQGVTASNRTGNANHVTISNLDSSMLQQLQSLKGAEEALKALTGIGIDKD